MGDTSIIRFFLDLLFLLPLILLVRAILPGALAFRLACIVAGLYLYYGTGPRLVLLVLAYWVLVWALQALAAAAERSKSVAFGWFGLVAVVTAPLVPMLAWKILPDAFAAGITKAGSKILMATAPGLGFADALVGFVVPIGLSFAAFRALDLLLKVYLGVLTPLSLDRVLYYGMFPPILALGPIAEYEELRADVPARQRAPDPGDIAVGLFRVAWGAVKILVIGQALERASAWAWGGGEASIALQWLALLLYGLFFYANFSGYSEIAIGAARILGVRLKENFNNPFLKTNPQAFWNAWHMSLTRWAQRYVFVPLGGMRPGRQYYAIFMTIMVIALWHGLAWPMVVFGVYHAVIVVGHRFLEDWRRRNGRAAPIDSLLTRNLKSLAVIGYVSFSIPLLLLDGSSALSFYAGLFGLN